MLTEYKTTVYFISTSSDGWHYIDSCDITDKDKKQLYNIVRHSSLDSYDDDYEYRNHFLFTDENKKWWRNYADAKKALNIKLKQMFDSRREANNKVIAEQHYKL